MATLNHERWELKRRDCENRRRLRENRQYDDRTLDQAAREFFGAEPTAKPMTTSYKLWRAINHYCAAKERLATIPATNSQSLEKAAIRLRIHLELLSQTESESGRKEVIRKMNRWIFSDAKRARLIGKKWRSLNRNHNRPSTNCGSEVCGHSRV